MLIYPVYAVFAATILMYFCIHWLHARDSRKCKSSHDIDDENILDPPSLSMIEDAGRLRDFFFKLQNLEDFPDVLPSARALLSQFLLSASTTASRQKTKFPILKLSNYQRPALEHFIKARDQDTASKYERYTARRAAGGPKELFGDLKEAHLWLRQQAPVKCVDGAWLSHLNRVTVPFSQRLAIRQAYQVLLEELGDGQIEQHHVVIFQRLMRSLDPDFPQPDCPGFIDPRHQLGSLCSWKAAVAQLVISLFAQQLLPEILGFNLHFEAVTEGTLKAIRELREVNLDPTYFLLHVCIDNADTGHTAIALEAVCTYLKQVEVESGSSGVHAAWQRIKQGYILSEYLAIDNTNVVELSSVGQTAYSTRNLAQLVADMFRKKIDMVGNVHCACKGHIGGRPVAEWLKISGSSHAAWPHTLVEALSKSKRWITPGNSPQSQFIRELQWGGRMFGAFTRQECEMVRTWVDHMVSDDQSAAKGLTEAAFFPADITASYPVFEPGQLTDARRAYAVAPMHFAPTDGLLYPLRKISAGSWMVVNTVWFTHVCLLENFVSPPCLAGTELGSHIIVILRAIAGLRTVTGTVGGTDEMARSDSTDVIGIGMEITASFGMTPAPTLRHVLEHEPQRFVFDLLHLSMRPRRYRGLLLGMAAGFVALHNTLASSTALSDSSKAYLEHLVDIESREFAACLSVLEQDSQQAQDYSRGFMYVRSQLEQMCDSGWNCGS